MTPQDLHIACCPADEIPALRQFFDECWRPGHILARDEALLRWQYDAARATVGKWPGPTILLAKRAERIVGLLGLICTPVNLGGQTTPAAWMAILLAIPEMRRYGVGLRLLQALPDMGFQAIFVLGINDQVKRIYRGLGYEILEDMPRWVGVMDGPSAVQLVDENGGPASRSWCESGLLHDGTSDDIAGDHRVEVVTETMPPDWDEAWRSVFAPRLVCTSRDTAYLKWRYLRHPTFCYEVRLVRMARGGAVGGLAVWRIEQIRDRQDRVLRLVEFLALPEAAAVLARAVVQGARDGGVTFADFYCTSASVAEPLEAVGFRRESSEAGALAFPSRFQPLEPGRFKLQGAFWMAPEAYRLLPGESRSLLGSNLFYATKSDGDMDRPN